MLQWGPERCSNGRYSQDRSAILQLAEHGPANVCSKPLHAQAVSLLLLHPVQGKLGHTMLAAHVTRVFA
jgi:hypothetical protein